MRSASGKHFLQRDREKTPLHASGETHMANIFQAPKACPGGRLGWTRLRQLHMTNFGDSPLFCCVAGNFD
jgi:hypothetical protein